MSERKTIDLGEGQVFMTTVTATQALNLGIELTDSQLKQLPFEERLKHRIANLPAQQLRGALHSLDLIAKGTPEPQHYAGIALKHLGVSPAPFLPQLPENMLDVFREAGRMLSKHCDGEIVEDFDEHLKTLEEIMKTQIAVPPVPLPPQQYVPAFAAFDIDRTVEDAVKILNDVDEMDVPANIRGRLFPVIGELKATKRVLADGKTLRMSGVMLGYVGKSAAEHLQDYTAHGTPNSIRVYNTPDVARGITKRVFLLDDVPPTK
jgi:hypothetical protein